jgi:hypothetical protein
VGEPLLTINWKIIENHIGYGRKDAPVVFVGMEEGADRNLEMLKPNLIERSSMPQFAEIDGKTLKTVRTWRVACDFMLRRAGHGTTNHTSRLEYQRFKLGRLNGDSLLTELMPYPSPGLDCWPYADLGRDTDRATYINRLMPDRLRLLSELLAAHPREFIVCYGKGYSAQFKKLFPADLNWQPNGSLEVAQWKAQRVAITPHFVSREFNTEQQMAALYRALDAR